MKDQKTGLSAFGRLTGLPRTTLMSGPTPLNDLPNLGSVYNGEVSLLAKRDDCGGLAFGGNKVRQLEFYFGEAKAQNADTILITGAVQSNFVRLAAAAARKLGMDCHIQLEERVAKSDPYYRTSGNVLLNKLLGATLHSYPDGEDEAGADKNLGVIAENLKSKGAKPYIVPLAPGHAPLGALGYIVCAQELLQQQQDQGHKIDEIVVASGSGNTHAGLLFGLRGLGSSIPVKGVCVRRGADEQGPRVKDRCQQIADFLEMDNPVGDDDVEVDDTFLPPGYGEANNDVMQAILVAARTEALMLDPTYTGKSMAGFMARASEAKQGSTLVFLHTGGTPAIFAYEQAFEQAFKRFA